MRKPLLVLVLAFVLQSVAFGQQITGKVVDDITGAALPFANIFIEEQEIGTSADLHGEFVLQYKQKLPVIIIVSYIGYKKQVVEVTDTQSPLVIKMRSLDYLLQQVNIYAKGDADVTERKYQLQNEQMKNFSGATRDALRAIQLLPGVSTNNAGSARYNVRGGNSDENLILINGVEVIEPFHMRYDPKKSVGIFNIDMVSKMDFSAGGFPAEYGNVMSSLLKVDYNNEHKQQFQGKIDLSLIDANLILGAPISDKLSFNIGLRKSFIQQLIELMYGSNDFDVNYFDLHGSLQYHFSPLHKLYFNLIYSGDLFDKDTGEKSYYADYITGIAGETSRVRERNLYTNTADVFYSNTLLSLKSEDVWSTRIKSETILSYYQLYEEHNMNWDRSSFALFRDYPEARHEEEERRSSFGSIDTKNLQLNTKWSFYLTDNYSIKAGAEIMKIDYNNLIENSFITSVTTNTLHYPDTSLYFEELDPLFNDTTNVQASTNAFGLFLQNQFVLTDDLIANLGARVDYFGMNENFNFSPRIAMAYNTPWGAKLNAAWGIYYKRPDYQHFRLGHASGENTKNFKTLQYTFGIEQNFSENVRAKLEYYKKTYSDIIAVERIHDGRLSYGNKLNDREGYAEGFDFNFSADSDNMYLWISYGYLVAKEKRLGTEEYYYRSTDQRHTLSALVHYKLGWDWDFSIKCFYGSGYPYTPYKKIRIEDESRYTWEVGEFNSDHLPSYLRFDLRLSKRFMIDKNPLLIYLDVLNAGNNKNIFAYEYDIKYGYPREKPIDLLGLMPSLGISYTF